MMQKESFQESAARGVYYKPISTGIFDRDNLSDSFSLPNYINSSTTTTTTNQALGYIVQNNQDLVNRHNLCLIKLRDSLLENEQLRVENTTLRDINERLRSLLIKNYQFPPLQMNPLDVSGLMKGFGGISIGGGERSSQSDRFNVDSPTSVLPENSDLVENDQRVILPKSISVRSNVYLKGQQGAGSSSAGGVISSGGTAQERSSSRVRPASPLSGKQKVYVRGGKEEGEPVELEVYNQGMFKTELCNKWQETGDCPYGNHCQFSHGIEELRPVIRHPRYKTEVCRMVLAGDSCPYGHRCHFRHALTDEEKLMMIRHS